MASSVKKRNLLGQVGLFIITCGLYSFYWFYRTCEEMVSLTGDTETSPALLTVLLFIPLANLFSYYKEGELYEKLTAGHFNRWLIFVLWMVFPPAVWFIIQTDLNKRADESSVA